MQTCDLKEACRGVYSVYTQERLRSIPCFRETEGTVDKCPNRTLMECGHAHAYLRWDWLTLSGPTYCAKCAEEARDVEAE